MEKLIKNLKNELETKINKNILDMSNKELNIYFFQLNHNEYIQALNTLLDILEKNFDTEVFDKVDTIFKNYFYLFKKMDENMKLLFIKYLDIYIERDEKLLNSKNKNILLKWYDIVDNPFNYLYEELDGINQFNFKRLYCSEYPDNVFNVKREIDFIVKKAYKIIRSDPEKTKEVYLLIDDLFYYFIDKDYNSIFYHKLLSLSSLKNDIALHKGLDEDQIDLYVRETLYLYSNDLCFGDSEGILKALENLSKAQFAYNLLGVDKNLKKEYKLMHKKLCDTYYFNKIHNNSNDEEFSYISEAIEFSNTNLQYVFFLKNKNYKTDELYKKMINFWSEHKHKYLYGSGKTRKVDIDKYNFIY